MSVRSRGSLLGILAAFAVLICAVGAAPASAGSSVATKPTSVVSTSTSPASEETPIGDLQKRASNIESILNLVLLPIAVLIGILCAGGIIGVVFSVRDQRRVSQLHELTVSSEMATQRRTEQSYNTFLAESQKTLTLVNDTLALAKEANEQATQKMQVKASDSLAVIEQKAEDLILDIITLGDYEEVVDVPENRLRLRAIAAELSSIEGYLRLQGMTLPPYSRFIKGIEQYLDGAVGAALQTLRHAALDNSNRQLQRGALYWAGKLNSAVGAFEHAENLFEQAIEYAGEDTIERYELERARWETAFFRVANASDASSAAQRFELVRPMLVKLERVAAKLDEKVHDYRDQHANHEVAATRADIYTWVAYEADDLCRQFPPNAISAGGELMAGGTFDGIVSVATEEDQEALESALALSGIEVRAWALQQALGVYTFQHDSLEQASHGLTGIDFSLAFGKAECHFALRDEHDIAEYQDLRQKALDQEKGAHREHRWTVELAQIGLISKARLLRHEYDKQGADVAGLEEAVKQAYSHLQDVLHGAPDHTVTLFSHLQRRNLDEEAFRLEAEALRDQALEPSGSTEQPVPA